MLLEVSFPVGHSYIL